MRTVPPTRWKYVLLGGDNIPGILQGDMIRHSTVEKTVCAPQCGNLRFSQGRNPTELGICLR